MSAPPVMSGTRLAHERAGRLAAGLQPSRPPTASYARTAPAYGPLQPVHGFRAYKDTPEAAFPHGVSSDG